MKKVFYLVIIISICFVGCETKQERIQRLQEDYKQTIKHGEKILSRYNEIENTGSNEEILQKIMNKYNVKYMGKDVEFDITNHLDEEFILVGQAYLSDYYNYGFIDLEEYYFCIKIEPWDETSQNDWYIYLDRKDFKKLYNELIDGKFIQVVIIGEIPEIYYKKHQGNLAIGNKVFW